jgi:AAA family ATP:ADP antiporter
MNPPTKNRKEAKHINPGVKILRIFTQIYPEEIPTVLLLLLNIFLLFTAYYIIKPVREALILSGKGAEWKSYLSAVIAVLLIFVVKAFSGFASKVSRQKLISWVTLFFISNLILFYILSFSGISLGTMGILFFIWVGIFNVLVVAQFWAFANDLYTEERGKRLFPLVAFGAPFGAFSGSSAAEWLVESLGIYHLMLVSAGLLGICIVLTLIVHNREVRIQTEVPVNKKDSAVQKEVKPLAKGGGFRLVFKKKYLLYLALFILLLNFVNTNGEFILGKLVKESAVQAVQTETAGGLSEEEYIGKFYAGFMKYFNLLALLMQLFVVSRIFKWLGVRTAVFILPLLALGGYFMIALGASLLLVKWVKIAENGTDYSLMNTTRHALFLITSREEKYKAKAAIDTFFHRTGDVLSALLVFVGQVLVFSTENFGLINVVLVLIWIFLGILIHKEHKKLQKQKSVAASGSA